MIEVEVCSQIFDMVAESKRLSSDVLAEELVFFDRKMVQSGIHTLMKAGLLDREKNENGFSYFIPKGVSKKEVSLLFQTASSFADIAAISPVPESKRNLGVVRKSKDEIRKEAIERARKSKDSILESLERIAVSSREASQNYDGADAFLHSVLEEAAKRSEEALSAYCDKLR